MRGGKNENPTGPAPRGNNTLRIALGGLTAAVSVVIFFLAGLIPYGSMALPMLAGVLLIPVTLELGSGWALMMFIAVSILAALLSPDKSAVAFYVAFFGYYPILKRNIEGLHLKWLQWVVKFVLFNVSMLAVYAAAYFLLGLPKEFNSLPYVALTAAVFELVFLLYDRALSGFVVAYFTRLRKMFKL